MFYLTDDWNNDCKVDMLDFAIISDKRLASDEKRATIIWLNRNTQRIKKT
jgi:hypothetical protein